MHIAQKVNERDKFAYLPDPWGKKLKKDVADLPTLFFLGVEPQTHLFLPYIFFPLERTTIEGKSFFFLQAVPNADYEIWCKKVLVRKVVREYWQLLIFLSVRISRL
jgi:hypothetical protein